MRIRDRPTLSKPNSKEHCVQIEFTQDTISYCIKELLLTYCSGGLTHVNTFNSINILNCQLAKIKYLIIIALTIFPIIYTNGNSATKRSIRFTGSYLKWTHREHNVTGSQQRCSKTRNQINVTEIQLIANHMIIHIIHKLRIDRCRNQIFEHICKDTTIIIIITFATILITAVTALFLIGFLFYRLMDIIVRFRLTIRVRLLILNTIISIVFLLDISDSMLDSFCIQERIDLIHQIVSSRGGILAEVLDKISNCLNDLICIFRILDSNDLHANIITILSSSI